MLPLLVCVYAVLITGVVWWYCFAAPVNRLIISSISRCDVLVMCSAVYPCCLSDSLSHSCCLDNSLFLCTSLQVSSFPVSFPPPPVLDVFRIFGCCNKAVYWFSTAVSWHSLGCLFPLLKTCLRFTLHVHWPWLHQTFLALFLSHDFPAVWRVCSESANGEMITHTPLDFKNKVWKMP